MFKKNRLAILLLIIILFFLSIGVLFEYEAQIKIRNNDIEYTCFFGKILNFHVLRIKNGYYPSKIKLLGFSKEAVNLVGVLKSKHQNSLIFTLGNLIKQYSLKGYLKTYRFKNDEAIVSTYISDIDNDDNDELLIITGKKKEKFGEKLMIFSFDDGLKKIYTKAFKDMNPWKIQTADVDGDGEKEISIGVYKESQFHPVKDKRPFIYNWNGDSISPKWRGSRLSRPFEDYIFLDIDNDGLDELISIEIFKNGKKIINSYKWKGFGFEGMAESKEYQDILFFDNITNKENKNSIIIKVKNGSKYEWILMNYIDKKIKVKNRFRKYIPVFNIN